MLACFQFSTTFIYCFAECETAGDGDG